MGKTGFTNRAADEWRSHSSVMVDMSMTVLQEKAREVFWVRVRDGIIFLPASLGCLCLLLMMKQTAKPESHGTGAWRGT